MIQKKLHFIWLGDNIPNYVNFAIENFRNVNKDFEIYKWFFTIKDIENPKDELLKHAIDDALKNKKLPYNKHKPFIVIVSDNYRCVLLKHYGGIYLDCDTFPIKPFDEKLLRLNNFSVTRSYENNEIIFNEIFFMGLNNDKKENYKHYLLYPVDMDYGNQDKVNLYKSFYNCTLEYGQHCNDPKRCYIDHYNDYSWNPNNCRVPLCKFDKI